ncbi:MAG TPA: M50 family metallopeptidase [Candidatus Saccharimonadia bacterium]|nr:M50 family metallopeptidase [Candidatus Saccharimonadia bacterium]
MAIILIILILSFLVLIHEFGHFLAARKVGVRVEEFGIGYPPRARKLFTWKGTLFSLNWLPFGGFVRLAGDDAETFEYSEVVEGAKHHDSHLFSEKSQMGRIIIVLAGAAVNILFGILIFSITYAYIGIPTVLPHPKVEVVMPNSPAEQAGIAVGDVVDAVSGQAVGTADELIGKIVQLRGQTVTLKIERDGKTIDVKSHVRTAQQTPANEGSLGIQLISTEFVHYPAWQMPFRGTLQGVKDSWMFAKMIPGVFGKVFVDLFTKAQISNDVSGPIGIVHIAQQEQIASQGLLAILNFAAVISLNLGVMNLMPIPALDGGRVVFILLETAVGKKRRAKWEGYANSAGMVALLALIVVISLHDVWKIFVK